MPGASTPDPVAATEPGRLRHGTESFFVEAEGLLTTQVGGRGAAGADPLRNTTTPRVAAATVLPPGSPPPFRFSRVGPRGTPLGAGLTAKLARAMVVGGGGEGDVPAGYTYLGQFVDHDLTMDRTEVMLGEEVSPTALLQGRSPSLDLDSLYGAGPASTGSARFFEADGLHLRTGTSLAIPPDGAKAGHDLPRAGRGPNQKARRTAVIPDPRNDENLIVAQTHVAMLRFHNAVVDKVPARVPAGQRFSHARRRVTLHYQWLIRHDYLPRICRPETLDNVWANGRVLVEPDATPTDVPTMPIEFSIAGLRLGHSMIRESYDWNRRFPGSQGLLDYMLSFSALGGDLGGETRLLSNWLADPLRNLPPSTFGGDDTLAFDDLRRNLAFRNLTRARMVRLASGQQLATRLENRGVRLKRLTRSQILDGSGGARLDHLTSAEKDAVTNRTPLWFYILREAELNGGRLRGVGARLVAETFHRAMEGSRFSLVREPDWRPTLGRTPSTFEMTDLLVVAFGGKKAELNPLGGA